MPLSNKSNETIKACNFALLFLAATLLLAGLFVNEYLHTKNATILGRVPLLIVAIVGTIYYTLQYVKLKNKA